MDLSGSVALVTGASGGIGQAVSSVLARSGAKVGLHYLTHSDAAAELEASITAAGGEAALFGGDVSDPDEVAGMVRGVTERWGKLDILVNNAGITRDALMLRMSPEAWDDVLNVNLRGAFLCTKQALIHMVRQRYGRIINMSSVVGVSGNPGQANYAASKAGLIGFTKAVAREVASRNVTVNAVAPGLHHHQHGGATLGGRAQPSARPHTAGPLRHPRRRSRGGGLPCAVRRHPT